MTEKEEAIKLANKILDRISADPDDDLAMLSRQFLRALEALTESQRRVAELSAIVLGEDEGQKYMARQV